LVIVLVEVDILDRGCDLRLAIFAHVVSRILSLERAKNVRNSLRMPKCRELKHKRKCETDQRIGGGVQSPGLRTSIALTA
jgi:hypothetical protein